MSGVRYTPEEEKFLAEKITDCSSFRELTDLFNDQFGTMRSISSVQDKCIKRLKIRIGKNSGQYGSRNKDHLPLGTIRKTSYGTYIKATDAGDTKYTGYQEPYWVPLQKKIYQERHGNIPNGYMVIFLDGDSENFSVDNLYPINRRISAMLASNGFYSRDPELTKTAIKLCELQMAIKDDV